MHLRTCVLLPPPPPHWAATRGAPLPRPPLPPPTHLRLPNPVPVRCWSPLGYVGWVWRGPAPDFCRSSAALAVSLSRQLWHRPEASRFPVHTMLLSQPLHHMFRCGHGEPMGGSPLAAAALHGVLSIGGNSQSSSGIQESCPVAGVPASRAAVGL